MRTFFSRKLLRALALFMASFLVAVNVASCTAGENAGNDSSVKSLAVVENQDIAPATAPSGTTLARIIETEKVRVAVPDDFPPFGSVNPNMELHGYDVDVANEVAKNLGVALELVPVVGNYRIPFLQTDRADMVISSLGKNEERAQIIDFSIPYAPFFSGIYGGQEIEVTSLEGLQGHTIGVAQGSLEDLELSKLPEGTIEIRRFASNSLTASALISGQVQLIATGNVVAAKLIRDNPDRQIENKFIMKDSPCHIGVRKGDTELVEQLNLIITDLRESGKLNELSLKWFGEPLPELPTT
jgi:polar amino acid transport system substrate-binding protein